MCVLKVVKCLYLYPHPSYLCFVVVVVVVAVVVVFRGPNMKCWNPIVFGGIIIIISIIIITLISIRPNNNCSHYSYSSY